MLLKSSEGAFGGQHPNHTGAPSPFIIRETRIFRINLAEICVPIRVADLFNSVGQIEQISNLTAMRFLLIVDVGSTAVYPRLLAAAWY
jgi:hypothetical protein